MRTVSTCRSAGATPRTGTLNSRRGLSSADSHASCPGVSTTTSSGGGAGDRSTMSPSVSSGSHTLLSTRGAVDTEDDDDDDEDGRDGVGTEGNRRRGRRRGNATGQGDNQRSQLTTSKSTNAVLERTGERGGCGGGGAVGQVVVEVVGHAGSLCGEAVTRANDVDGRARMHHHGEHGFLSDASTSSHGNQAVDSSSDPSDASGIPSDASGFPRNACNINNTSNSCASTHNASPVSGISRNENDPVVASLPRVPSYHSYNSCHSNTSRSNVSINNHSDKSTEYISSEINSHLPNEEDDSEPGVDIEKDKKDKEENEDEDDDDDDEEEEEDEEDDVACYELASSACYPLSSLPDEVTRSDPGSLASRATSCDEDSECSRLSSRSSKVAARRSSVMSNGNTSGGRRMSRKDSFLGQTTPSDDCIRYVLTRRQVTRVGGALFSPTPRPPLTPSPPPPTSSIPPTRRRFDFRIVAELRNASPSTKDDTINTDSCADSEASAVASIRSSSSRSDRNSKVRSVCSNTSSRSTKGGKSSRANSSGSASRLSARSGRNSRQRAGETPGRAVCSRCEGFLQSSCSSASFTSSYESTSSTYSSFDSTGEESERTAEASDSNSGEGSSEQSTPRMSPNHSPLPVHPHLHHHHQTPMLPLHGDVEMGIAASDVDCITGHLVSNCLVGVGDLRAPIASQESLVQQMMQCIPMADASSVSSFTSDDSGEAKHHDDTNSRLSDHITPCSTTTSTPTNTAATTLTREPRRHAPLDSDDCRGGGGGDIGDDFEGEEYLEEVGDRASVTSDTDSTTGDNFTTTEDEEVVANYANYHQPQQASNQLQMQHERHRRHLQRSNEFQRAIEAMFREAIVYSSSEDELASGADCQADIAADIAGDIAGDNDGEIAEGNIKESTDKEIQSTISRVSAVIDRPDDQSTINEKTSEPSNLQPLSDIQPLHHPALHNQISPTMLQHAQNPANARRVSMDSSADEDLPPPPPLPVSMQPGNFPPPPQEPHSISTTSFPDADFPPLPHDYPASTLPLRKSRGISSTSYSSSTLPSPHLHSCPLVVDPLPPALEDLGCSSPLLDPLPPPRRSLILSTIYSDVETHEDCPSVDILPRPTLPAARPPSIPRDAVQGRAVDHVTAAYALDYTSHENDEYSDSDDCPDEDEDDLQGAGFPNRSGGAICPVKSTSFDQEVDDEEEEDVGDILDRCDVAPIRESPVTSSTLNPALPLEHSNLNRMPPIEESVTTGSSMSEHHYSSEVESNDDEKLISNPGNFTLQQNNVKVDSDLAPYPDQQHHHHQHNHNHQIRHPPGRQQSNDAVFESLDESPRQSLDESPANLTWSAEHLDNEANDADELDDLLMRAVAPCEDDALVA